MSNLRSAARTLLDPSFSSYVARDIIRAVYKVALAFTVLGVLIGLAVFFHEDGAERLLGLGLIMLNVLGLFAARVVLEVVVVVFRIADHARAASRSLDHLEIEAIERIGMTPG